MTTLTQKITTATTAFAIAATAFIGSAQAGPDDRDKWITEAAALVDSQMTYPSMALRKGHSGQALIDVTLDDNGTITSFTLASSTGSGILDQAAKRTVARIGAFPAPDFATDDQTTVRVSLNYFTASSAAEERRINRRLLKSGSVSAQQIAAKGGAPVLASVAFLDE